MAYCRATREKRKPEEYYIGITLESDFPFTKKEKANFLAKTRRQFLNNGSELSYVVTETRHGKSRINTIKLLELNIS